MFEYTYVQDVGIINFTEEINHLAKANWELVSAYSSGTNIHHAIMRREFIPISPPITTGKLNFSIKPITIEGNIPVAVTLGGDDANV